MRRAKRNGLGLAGRVADSLARAATAGRQNFTILLIPHSEKKIVNFKVSILGLLLLAAIGTGVVGALAFYAFDYAATVHRSELAGSRLEVAQTNLDLVREEVALLRTVADKFEGAMHSTLGVVGVAALPSTEAPAPATVREVGELADLRLLLSSTSEPLKQIGEVLSSQRSLLVEIPTLWPLKDVQGWVTSPFGPTIHPFSGQWYLHKGFDIAQRMGTPVVATANGRVAKVSFEALGYGHYVEIKHNYGFSTKFGHLFRSYVTKGQDVVRGQVIAALGSSGLSTGPHLHYEVRIGPQVVDPTKYLSFSSNLFHN